MPSTESNNILAMLSTAPTHILLQIAKYLSPEEFAQLQFLSQDFKHLFYDRLKDEYHWKKLAKQTFPPNNYHQRSQLSNIAHLSSFDQYVRLHQAYYNGLTSRAIQLFSAVKSRDVINLENLKLTFDELALKDSSGYRLYDALADIGHQPMMDYVFSSIIMPYYYQNETVSLSKIDNQIGFTVLNHAAALNQVSAIHAYIKLPDSANDFKYQWINERSLELAARFGHSASVKAFITHFEADLINMPHYYNMILESALCGAAKNGHHSTVKTLLKHGVNINCTSTQNFSPIYYAAASGSFKTFKACLNAGANPSPQFTQPLSHSTLHAAIEGGNMDILETMLVRKDISDQLTDNLKVALLHYSAEIGNLYAFKRFLQLALDASLHPIHLIHFKNEHLLNNAIKSLNISIIKTILAFATQHKLIHIIAGVGKNNTTPLHHAAYRKNATPEHNEIFDLLLAITPNIDMPSDELYETPLDRAAMNREDINIYALTALLKRGANPNGSALSQTPPLFKAIHCNTRHALKKTACLIEHKANINLPSAQNNGYSPLHLATTLNRIDIMRMLLDHGANINSIDNHGNTPLHLAMMKSHECAVLLLERGANFKAVNLENNRPLNVYLKNLYDLNYDLIDAFLAKGDSIEETDIRPTYTPFFTDKKISRRVFFALLKAATDTKELFLKNLEIKADQTPLNESTLPEDKLPNLKVISISSSIVLTPDTAKILTLIIQAAPNLLKINIIGNRDRQSQEILYRLLCDIHHKQKYPQATRILASLYETGICRDDDTYSIKPDLAHAKTLYSQIGDAQGIARVEVLLKLNGNPGLFALPPTDKPDNKRTSEDKGNSPKRQKPC